MAEACSRHLLWEGVPHEQALQREGAHHSAELYSSAEPKLAVEAAWAVWAAEAAPAEEVAGAAPAEEVAGAAEAWEVAVAASYL